MKTISKFLFFAFLLFFNSAFADLASDAEKLFSWGEQKYPSYFPIGETEVVTKVLNYKGHDWYYRYYPETKVFLAINELNKVYVLGGVFGKNLLYVGRLEDLLDVPSSASSAQLKGNLSNANVKVYRVEDNADKTLLYQEQTDSNGEFDAHEDKLDDDKFYIYEVSGGIDNKGTIRAVTKGSWIKKQGLKVSLASEIAYIYLAKDLKYGFDASKVDNRLNEVAQTIFNIDISGDGKVTNADLLVFDYQNDFNAINKSKFSDSKIEEIALNISRENFSYVDDISKYTIGNYNSGYAFGVTLSQDGTKAFIAGGGHSAGGGKDEGLVIVDISNPANPIKIGSYDTNGNAMKITLSHDETKVYIADDSNGLVITDISDLTNPIKIGHFDTNGFARGIALSQDGTKAFVADDYNGLVILDVKDTTNPVKIGNYNTSGKGNVTKIVLSNDGTKAYLADYANGLLIFDITNPTKPIKIGSLDTKTNGFGGAWDITLSIDGTKAFVAKGDPMMNDGGLVIVDITNPTQPIKIGEFNTNRNVRGVTLSKDETKVFLANEENSLLLLDITDSKNPIKIGGFDIGWINKVSLSSDDTKVFVATSKGLSILDLELFNPIQNKPIVKAPKTTTNNSVTAKVTAPVGSQIVVNYTNTGVSIPEYGEANITLDTSGTDGNKTFAIKFINIEGVESDEIIVKIEKKSISHNGFSYGTVTSPYTGRIWLDRNLGASQICTAYNDELCYGDYYQWGRNTDGHEKSNSSTTAIREDNILNTRSKFVTNSNSSPYDWTNIDDNGSLRQKQWNKTDGTSVCPIGFRVPTYREYTKENIGDNDFIGVYDSLTAFNSFLKLPSAGYRHISSTASIGDKNQIVSLWSNTIINDRAYGRTVPSPLVAWMGVSKAYGYSLRCIKD